MDIGRLYDGIADRFRNGDMDRRSFLRSVGRLAVLTGVGGSAVVRMTGPAQAAGTIRYDGFGGYSQSAYDRLVLKPFSAKTGYNVVQGSYGSPDAFIAQLQAEGIDKYNLFWAASDLTPIQAHRRGWIMDIDEARVPRLKDLIPKVVEVNRQRGKGKLLSIPYCLSGGAIAFNTKSVDAAYVEKHGFNVLLDPKFKGNVSGFENWQYRTYYGALQAGQNPNNITDIQAVWQKVREAKQQVLKFWITGAEQVSLLTSGSVAMTDAWFVPIHNLRKQGHPIDYWPKKGSYTQTGTLVALKGTPPDALYEMVDILLRPEVSFALATETGNLSLLDPRKFDFPQAVRDLPGYDPTGTLEGYRSFDPIYWEENGRTWQREFIKVLSRA